MMDMCTAGEFEVKGYVSGLSSSDFRLSHCPAEPGRLRRFRMSLERVGHRFSKRFRERPLLRCRRETGTDGCKYDICRRHGGGYSTRLEIAGPRHGKQRNSLCRPDHFPVDDTVLRHRSAQGGLGERNRPNRRDVESRFADRSAGFRRGADTEHNETDDGRGRKISWVQ